VLEQLVEAGHKVRALVRDPAKLGDIGRKVEVAKGDLSKPETLAAAFAGAEKVFVVAAGGDIPTLVGNAANAAKTAGVKHVVFLSSASVIGKQETIIGRWHKEAEAKIKATGLPWTMIQPGAFASNALQWAGSIKAQGAVFQPTGDGKTTPIDARDIAAVAVKALTSPGHEGKSYLLSGPEALSAAEQVATIGAAIGKPLRFVDVPEQTALENMKKAGAPEEFIRAMGEVWSMVRAGHGTEATSTVEELLGRQARTFEAWVADNVKAFQ